MLTQDPRGSAGAMRAVWSDQSRIQRYLDVEKALCLTQGRLGVIPQTAADEIAAHCDARELDFGTLAAAARHAGHQVLPVVEQLTALCAGGLGRWCHWGATAQDVTDAATVLQVREGLALVGRDLGAVRASLRGLARRHRDTPMTFGAKVAVWRAGLDRHAERLAQLEARVLLGGFGGAAGPAVREGLTEALGLARPPRAWHGVRDTIAEVGCFLALVCGSLDRIATDVDVMATTGYGESHGPGGGGRGASGAAPERRNPVACASITARGRAVRQHAAALLDAMSADADRAAGTWAVEWVALPAIFCYSADALDRTASMLGGLLAGPSVRRRARRGAGRPLPFGIGDPPRSS